MKNSVSIAIITVAAAVIIAGLLRSPFGTGPMLYVIVPFAISVVLYLVSYNRNKSSKGPSLSRHLLAATVIFLGASVLMMEGVICIAMFAPIYYLIVAITYHSAAHKAKWEREQALKAFEDREDGPWLKVYVWPVLIFAMATDGMLPQTTFPRDRTATYVTVTDQDITTLKANMAAPISMPAERNWFLRLFPLPDAIQAGSLQAGDTHNLHFTYKRWIWSNFHTGEMDILIAKNDPQHIQTQVIKNTSYLSHYMNVEGTDVYFTPLADGRTEVSLTVKYERLLDPAWYFGPLQQFAAQGSAKYLVENIIIRDAQE